MTHKCSICGAKEADEWEVCTVCKKEICNECSILCSKCGKPYCIDKCGDDFINPYRHHYCFNCK